MRLQIPHVRCMHVQARFTTNEWIMGASRSSLVCRSVEAVEAAPIQPLRQLGGLCGGGIGAKGISSGGMASICRMALSISRPCTPRVEGAVVNIEHLPAPIQPLRQLGGLCGGGIGVKGISSSKAPGDVDEGTSVGTSVSVGEVGEHGDAEEEAPCFAVFAWRWR